MKRKITKSEVVWHTADTPSGQGASLHAYYGNDRYDTWGIVTGDSHNGNSALCNKGMGLSDDGETFLTIEQIEPHTLQRNAACRRCLKIYDSLPNSDQNVQGSDTTEGEQRTEP